MTPLLSTSTALADGLLPAFEAALRAGLAFSGASGSRLLGFASDHVLALGAVGGGLFLASELLARARGPRNPDRDHIASRLGISPDALMPIGDGIQLWRDATAIASKRSRLRAPAGQVEPQGLGPVSDTVPPGAPTLVLSGLALTPSGLFLVAIHDLDLRGLRISKEQPGVASAPVTTWDGFTGTFLKRRLDFSVDDDAARRAFLLERIAGARLGEDLTGRIRPLVLTMRGPGSTLPADALREGLPLAAGRTIPHVDIEDAAAIARATSDVRSGETAPAEAGGEQEIFTLLSEILASQNARMTPRRRVVRRAVVAAACAVLWAFQGTGITAEAVSSGLAAVEKRLSPPASVAATPGAPGALGERPVGSSPTTELRPRPRP